MRIWTDAIDAGGNFDPRYTCDIDNSSPELHWEAAPLNTAGFVLMVEDLDSRPALSIAGQPENSSLSQGPFSHWIVYHIPKEIFHLPAGIPPQDALPNGIRQGLNGFNKLGYSGPCPPKGSKEHRYVFKLFSLSQLPDIPSRANREVVLSIIMPFVSTIAELHGKYRRHSEKAG